MKDLSRKNVYLMDFQKNGELQAFE